MYDKNYILYIHKKGHSAFFPNRFSVRFSGTWWSLIHGNASEMKFHSVKGQGTVIYCYITLYTWYPKHPWLVSIGWFQALFGESQNNVTPMKKTGCLGFQVLPYTAIYSYIYTCSILLQCDSSWIGTSKTHTRCHRSNEHLIRYSKPCCVSPWPLGFPHGSTGKTSCLKVRCNE